MAIELFPLLEFSLVTEQELIFCEVPSLLDQQAWEGTGVPVYIAAGLSVYWINTLTL